MTMRTVMAALGIELEAAETVAASLELVGAAADEVTNWVTRLGDGATPLKSELSLLSLVSVGAGVSLPVGVGWETAFELVSLELLDVEDDEDEEVRRAIAESQREAQSDEDQDVEEVEREDNGDNDDGDDVVLMARRPREQEHHVVYDDEDAELQAALKASRFTNTEPTRTTRAVRSL